MRSRWRIVALLLVLAVAVYLFRGAKHRSTRLRLPNGSKFELHSVTYGTSHEMVEGNLWNRMKYRLLPVNPINLFGKWLWRPSAQTVSSPDPILVFWLRHVGSVKELSLQEEHWRAIAFNEEGKEIETLTPFGGSYLPVMAWRMPVYPRTGKKIGLRIYYRETRESNSWKLVGEFVTKNPKRGPQPTWQAQTLPVTRRNGDSDFTLSSLKVETLPSTSPNSGDGNRARAIFHVAEGGQATTAWVPDKIMLSDSSGNRSVCRVAIWEATDGHGVDLRYLVDPSLPWKLSVDFRKERDFTKEQLWIIRDVLMLPDPKVPAVVRPHQFSTNLHGAELRLIFLGTALNPAGFVCEAAPLPKNSRLDLAALLDQEGRQITNSFRRSHFPHQVIMEFHELPSHVKKIDLVFALQQFRHAQYLVEPARATPARISGR